MVWSNINTGVSGKYSNKHVYTRQLNLKEEAKHSLEMRLWWTSIQGVGVNPLI